MVLQRNHPSEYEYLMHIRAGRATIAPVQRPNKKKVANMPLSDKIRLLVVDDHKDVRKGVQTLIEAEGWEMCGEAKDGLDAVEKAKSLKPDIIILDITLPKLDGVQAARQILQHDICQKIIILIDSEASSDALVLDCLRLGVKGYLLKSDPARDLVAAIKALACNTTFFTYTAKAMLSDFSVYR